MGTKSGGERPAVSVIVPVYNKEDYVIPCVDSVLAQTMADRLEILLVDDCSTDGSLSLLRETYGRHPQIRILQTEENSGAGMARKFGLAYAKAEKIVFVDADDIVLPNHVKRMHDMMERLQADIVNEGDHRIWKQNTVLPEDRAQRLPFLLDYRVNTNVVQQMATKKLLQAAIRHFSGMRCFEDAFLGIVLLCMAKRYVMLSGSLYQIVRTPDSVTRGNLLAKIPGYVADTMEVFQRFADFKKDLPLFQENPMAGSMVYTYLFNLSIELLFKPVFQNYPIEDVSREIYLALRERFTEGETVYIQLLLNKLCIAK